MIDLRKKTIDQLVNEARAQEMLDNPEEFFLDEENLEDYNFEDPDEHE